MVGLLLDILAEKRRLLTPETAPPRDSNRGKISVSADKSDRRHRRAVEFSPALVHG